MSNNIHLGEEAKEYLIEGLNKVSNVVKTTLGPSGNTVIIQKKGKAPIITKDGVSVAKALDFKDNKIKLGADLAISIANKQANTCGDGTTTSTVLGQAIINKGIRQIELSENRINPMSVKKGIDLAKDVAINFINNSKIVISSKEELANIAAISANNDKEIGNIIADVYDKVGKDGVVLVEETKNRNVSYSFKEGMTLNKGWVNQSFINKFDTQTVEFDNPRILLCNSKLSNITALATLIEPVLKEGNPLVIIAESFDTSIINFLITNTIMAARQGMELKVACVEAPSYSDRRLDILRDLGIYLDARVGDDPLDIKLDTMSTADFGSCDRIVIKKDETIISGGHGDSKAIEEQIAKIKGLISAVSDKDQFEKEQLNKRLACLTTGIAVIHVGGSSEEEIKELRDRIDDSQWATKAALEEGYVPGGGISLLRLYKFFDNECHVEDDSDVQLGKDIFKLAMKAPFENILLNAGVSPEEIMKDIFNNNDLRVGYDAKQHKVCNLIDAGVIDPVKVVKGAIYAASSIAGTILTSNAIIVEDNIKDDVEE